MADIAGMFYWPGAFSIVSGNYPTGQGTAPGLAVLVTAPQANPPNVFGDLIISDGFNRPVVLRDCRLKNLNAHGDVSSGFTWTLEIEDRRWRWRDLGNVAGSYNAVDKNGQFNQPANTNQAVLSRPTKRIPWTEQRINDLIKILLDAMGETGYTITLPQFTLVPQPQVDWDYVNPAQCLSALTESIGCRIVLRHDTNTVAICPAGVGASLPDDGAFNLDSPALSGLSTPDSLLLVGKPVRYQLRVLLEAVGEEWNGQLRPIDALSYAPQSTAQRWVAHWTVDDVDDAALYTLVLDGKSYTYQAVGGNTGTDIANGLANKVNADPAIAKQGIQVSAALTNGGPPSIVQATGPASGVSFAIGGRADGDGQLTAHLIQVGKVAGGDWSHSAPPSFWAVIATERLTKRQARQKAANSVFKWYRAVNVDPATGKGPLVVPGFGKLVRIQQLLLQSNQIEQIMPAPADTTQINKTTGEPLIQNYYDGYSRDKPPLCYGSYFWPAAGVVLPVPRVPNTYNSPANNVVSVSFSIDPERSLVMFSEPVYVRGGKGGGDIAAARLVLQTACQVRDPVTNAVVRATAVYMFSGGHDKGQPFVIKAPDFEINYAAQYPPAPDTAKLTPAQQVAAALAGPNKVVGVLNDLQDATARANYYLLGEATKWELKLAQQRRYLGLRSDIVLDGAIQRITWSAGAGGCTTTVSRNSDHALHLPAAPERIRIEYMRAAQKDAAKDVPGFGGAPKVDGGK